MGLDSAGAYVLQDTEFKLSTGGLSVMSLHGEMGKVQRQNVLAAFSRGEIRALVVSDIAARGLDIQNCDAVINLELPSDAAHYAHRAGRTGRIGR
jgi:superfamily II DNA/RNA helicase